MEFLTYSFAKLAKICHFCHFWHLCHFYHLCHLWHICKCFFKNITLLFSLMNCLCMYFSFWTLTLLLRMLGIKGLEVCFCHIFRARFFMSPTSAVSGKTPATKFAQMRPGSSMVVNMILQFIFIHESFTANFTSEFLFLHIDLMFFSHMIDYHLVFSNHFPAYRTRFKFMIPLDMA